MEFHLRPEQELFIRAQINQGRFATPDEAVQAAVALMEEQESVRPQPAPNEKRESLADFLLRSPLAGSGLTYERSRDLPRPVSFD